MGQQPTGLATAAAEQLLLVLIQVVVVLLTPVEEEPVKQVLFLPQAKITPEEVVVVQLPHRLGHSYQLGQIR